MNGYYLALAILADFVAEGEAGNKNDALRRMIVVTVHIAAGFERSHLLGRFNKTARSSSVSLECVASFCTIRASDTELSSGINAPCKMQGKIARTSKDTVSSIHC